MLDHMDGMYTDELSSRLDALVSPMPMTPMLE
jgi:hypothetical protein